MAELEPEPELDLEPKARAWASVEDSVPVVHLAGELDLWSVEAVRPVVTSVLADVPERILVDLEELSFMDSSGIALLLSIAAEVPRITVRNASEMIAHILTLTGLTNVLPLT